MKKSFTVFAAVIAIALFTNHAFAGVKSDKIIFGDDTEQTTAGGSGYYAPDSMVTVQRGTNDILSAANLRTAYTAAAALTPGGNALAADNRAVVYIPAGRYDFGTGDGSNHGLELDTEFVDLVGMTGNREDVVLTSAITVASRGTVEQTADDVKIGFLTMEIVSSVSPTMQNPDPAAYFPATALTNTVMSDVICLGNTSMGYGIPMRIGIEYAGTYTRVDGGGWSFAGGQNITTNSIASGTFTDCVGGTKSFGAGNGAIASGDFIRCNTSGGGECFGSGGNNSVANGNFTDCVGGNYCFASDWSGQDASGVFIRCIVDAYSFGNSGTASGTFIDCDGGSAGSFGSTVDSGAVFTRCSPITATQLDGTVKNCYFADGTLVNEDDELGDLASFREWGEGKDANDNWRIGVVNSNFVIQVRVSGTWTTATEFTRP